jgi:amino acid adenylation domain-containing protein
MAIVDLAARLNELFEIDLGVGEVFACPGVGALARSIFTRALSNEKGLEGSPKQGEIERVDRAGELPLSFAQQRLWFLTQLDGQASRAYHIGFGLRLRGRLDRTALRAALDRIVYRHESLRTSFVASHGVPRQRIWPEGVGFVLRESVLSGADAQERLKVLMEKDSSAEFDLIEGPLIRGHLVRMGEQEHVLLLTMHHIVSDGWSIGVLLRELTKLYEAYREGREDPLASLEIQYADYAQWQRQWLQGERLQTQIAYWRSALAGAPQLLRVPIDHPRPAVQSFAGAQVEVELDEDLTAGLKELSRQHGTTLFMTVLAGWAVLLSRLSGQEDVVIGTPVANRGRTEIEPLIGFFVNTLAIRVDLSGGPNAVEMLRRVRERVLQGQENQDVPFERIVEVLKPDRTLSHSPVFQVVLAWQNLPQANRVELEGLSLEGLVLEDHSSKFDLTLSLWESGGRVVGSLEYATALFERGTVDRYLAYWKRLLQGMVAEEALAVDRLPMLDEAESEQLLKEWNRTEVEYPSDRCLHELFEEHVRRTPDAVAVQNEGGALSYGELNARANRLAHYLRDRGVAVGEPVVILLRRSVDLIICEIAVLKCGAVYVPVDMRWPKERQAFAIRDCQAKLVLCEGSVASSEPPDVRRIVIQDVLAEDPVERSHADRSSADPGVTGSPRSGACVMYTFGSRAELTGVVASHRAISRLVTSVDYFDADVTDCVAFAANPAFDTSTFEMWAALLNGARLAVIDEETLQDPRLFGAALRTHGVSVLWMAATLFNRYQESLAPTLRELRCLIVGGDGLNVRAVSRQLRAGAPGRLLNGYGPTEATMLSSTYEIKEVPEAGATSIPIGRPTANTKIYLLDRHRQPVPAGVVGEIYIGGAGIALGYLNHPELTAERFVEDPFSGEGRARMYRTGDLGRHRADGNIELLGCNDHQVKVRGHRIDLWEIESQLRSHASVREAVVATREEARGEQSLVGYYVPEADQDPEVESLRAHLKRRLPEYMVPAVLVRLERLPLIANGRLGLWELLEPEGGLSDLFGDARLKGSAVVPNDKGMEQEAEEDPIEQWLREG